jgi:hypothetical protein
MLGEFRFNGSFPIGICLLFLRRVIRGDNLLSGSMPTDLERNSGISYLEETCLEENIMSKNHFNLITYLSC